jgi:hypothetical protein
MEWPGVNITAVHLMELMLQSLIYVESANLRHIPQLLCFIFYVIRSSEEFDQVRLVDRTPELTGFTVLPNSSQRWCCSAELKNMSVVASID